MKQILLDFFASVFNFLDAGWCFLITLFLLLCLFTISLILALKKETFTFNKKCGFVTIGVALILLEAFCSVVQSDSQAFTVFNLAVFFCCLSPFLFIGNGKRREVVLTDEQKTVVRNLDLVIKEEKEVLSKKENDALEKDKSVLFHFEKILKGNQEKPLESKVIRAVKETSDIKTSDFSNVKKAIEKTLQKELSSKERQRLLGLEIAILQSERGEDSVIVKEEVNEGLSALLKIMSKYAV